MAAVVAMAGVLHGDNLPLWNGDTAQPMPADLNVTGPGPAGTVVFGPSNYSVSGATLQHAASVYDIATGKLAFWYRLLNNTSSSVGFNYLGITMPTTATSVELNQQLDAAAGRKEAASASFLGSVVGFNYTDRIGQGQSTTWAVVYTDFTTFTGGPGYTDTLPVLVRAADGSISVNLRGVGPAGVPVPEPGTYAAVFALGLAGFAAYRRHRG